MTAETKAAPEGTEGETKDFLSMSDEEIMGMTGPGDPPKEPEEKEKPADAPADDAAEPEEETADETAAEPAADKTKDTKAEPAGTGKVVDSPSPGSRPEVEAKGGKGAKDEKKSDGVDYENFFKQVTTPFRANGKTVEVKTPEEALRLMQMGAGFGKKMNDLQPHLKVIRMLQKNDLLDTGKLSFLIDLNQKNPDAIKKFIKDTGIDPLDLNTDEAVTYTPRSHAVSDKESAFQDALDDIQTHPSGQITIQVINQTWDAESKALLWETPSLFEVIQAQRESGVYDQISTEIDRQKMMGTIPHSTPFLQAYKIAGDHLIKVNGFTAQIQPQAGAPNGNGRQPQVIATRTAVPKNQASNSDKAAAASSTKSTTTRKPNLTVNPLEMSDDEFMKQFANR